jgi:holo-[acyl-carrier protein] synthase
MGRISAAAIIQAPSAGPSSPFRGLPAMPCARQLVEQLQPALATPVAGVRVGIDTVSVASIADSLSCFGDRFMQRLFTAVEQADAQAVEGEAAMHERLAARFAAKEAVIKALDLPEAGVSWRDIELTRGPGGRPALALHGRAAAVASRLGVHEWAVSISHEGGHACAVVAALTAGPRSETISSVS